ncbi:MAG: cell division protein FtsZ [Rhodospirillaceae bacterium]|nr:cell division protein FtsZ [Rhodospirillaceae bacterium]
MTINITVPKTNIEAQLKPRITVVGVGGAGGNAVNNMIQAALDGVDFVVANTDAQALATSRTDRRIQLGRDTTQGLGAGARPDIGRHAAEEAIELIVRELEGSHMAFITAGMGGGTGTGAAPVIARVARECGILVVGVVTKPFHFEGAHRMRLAESGIEELAGFVDTLIVIPNQNLFRVANEKTTFADAFKMADDVLYGGVRSVTDLMMMPGLINLDFADVRTVMKEMGRAMMGSGEASGDRRALDAAEAAIANPLLEETSMRGAKGVLINITGGNDITLFEVDEAANRIRDEVETDAHIIFGSAFDESLEGRIRVSVVATGIESEAGIQPRPMNVRKDVRAVGKLLPEVKPVMPVAARAPAAVAAATVQPVAAPMQPATAAQPQLGFGATLAPAAASSQLAAEDVQLAQMAAAIRDEMAAPEPIAEPAPEIAEAAEPAPAPMIETPAPKPQAAQAAAVAEAMKSALPVGQPRLADRPLAARPAMLPLGSPARPEARPTAPAAAVVAPKADTKPESAGQRVSLFHKYRSLTARLRSEPQEQAVKSPPAATPAPQPVAEAKPAASALNISVGPADRPVMSQSEDELDIPAFLRRQAN